MKLSYVTLRCVGVFAASAPCLTVREHAPGCPCLQIEGSTNPLKFCQAFQFIHNGTSYYVHNDVFRLNYG